MIPNKLSCLLNLLLCTLGLSLARHFASQLYSEVARVHGHVGNILVSPIALRAALGALSRAIPDALELNRLAHLWDDAEADVSMLNLNKSVVTFSVVNRLYFGDHSTIQPKYQQLINAYQHMNENKIDFLDGPAEDRTDNKFVQQLTSIGLSTPTLISVAYFQVHFSQKRTNHFRMPFFHKADQQIHVNAYRKKAELRFGHLPELDASCLELTHNASNLSMLILLPKAYQDNLTLLESQIAGIDLHNINVNHKMNTVALTMPIFKVQFEPQMVKVLRNLGLGELFDGSVNFGGLAKTEGAGIVSNSLRVMHNSYVEVSPKFDSLAVDNTNMARTYNAAVDFIANHPFIFVIKDALQIYFIGRVTEPM